MEQFNEYQPGHDKINWYPGHMHRAMRLMGERIQDVQLFLEVRDARVPFSSKNYHFDTLMEKYQKEKLILFNKWDLCDQEATQKIIQKYQSVGIRCAQVSAKQRINLREILNMAQSVRSQKFATVGIWLMICGMPNVGKSTLINQLRQTTPKLSKRKALAKQTPIPCTTKTVTGIRICDEPLAFLVDSPGVMLPNITSYEQGMKLGLIGSIKDTITQKERLMDYLVWAFNKQNQKKYYEAFGLIERPKNGGDYTLQVREKLRQFNYETTFDHILQKFRDGGLGKITLDDPNVLE